jgi:hypothetical protein
MDLLLAVNGMMAVMASVFNKVMSTTNLQEGILRLCPICRFKSCSNKRIIFSIAQWIHVLFVGWGSASCNAAIHGEQTTVSCEFLFILSCCWVINYNSMAGNAVFFLCSARPWEEGN